MQGQYSIFASVGNATQPFDRLVRMVDEAVQRIGCTALIQTGRCTYTPRFAEAIDFVAREQWEALVRGADHFITHAGAGSVVTAIQFGKIPIVLPRRKSEREHVNDHQKELAEALSRIGWIRVIASADEIVECIAAPPTVRQAHPGFSNRRMCELVAEFIN